MQIQTIPEGYKPDANGNLIPLANIREVDLLRDELVIAIAQRAKEVQQTLRSFRDATFGDIAAFIELSGERYGAKVGGKKGNVTLYSFDGKYKIVRDITDHLKFDEGIQAAKALINECLDEWTEGSPSEIKALVSRAFEVDAEGNLSTNRILGLRRVEITDLRWKRAMDAIAESVQVIGSKPYVRIYERVGDDCERYMPIPLNIASL